MFGLVKKIFIGLLTGLANWSNHTKCRSLSNHKHMIQSALIDLHPDEYNQKFCYSPFAVKLGRSIWSCNTLNDLSNKVCALKNRRYNSKSVQHDYSNKWIKKK